MRVTESQLMDIASQGVSQAMTNVSTTGEIVSTGERVNLPSDDPTAWAQGMRAEARTTRSTYRASAISASQDRLSATDGALSSVSTILQQVATLGVQMSNGTLSASDRATGGDQVRALEQSLLAAVNTQDADGQYVLAGSAGGSPAFDNSGKFVGDASDRVVQVGEGADQDVSVSGSLLTAASGVDVYGAVDAIATAMENNDAAGVSQQLDTINQAIAQVASARATVGVRQSALTAADNSRQTLEENLASMKANALDGDAAKAASDFTNAKNALDAAQTLAQQIVQLTQPK